MSITIKFFANLRQQIGQSEIKVDLPSQTTRVDALWQQINNEQSLPNNVLCAINFEYAKATDIINDGDEVAFFPPVTGG